MLAVRLPKSLHAELRRIAQETGYDLEAVVDHFLWCSEERLDEWLPPKESERKFGGFIRKAVLAKFRSAAKKRGYNVRDAAELCLAQAVAEFWAEKASGSKPKNSAGQK